MREGKRLTQHNNTYPHACVPCVFISASEGMTKLGSGPSAFSSCHTQNCSNDSHCRLSTGIRKMEIKLYTEIQNLQQNVESVQAFSGENAWRGCVESAKGALTENAVDVGGLSPKQLKLLVQQLIHKHIQLKQNQTYILLM